MLIHLNSACINVIHIRDSLIVRRPPTRIRAHSRKPVVLRSPPDNILPIVESKRHRGRIFAQGNAGKFVKGSASLIVVERFDVEPRAKPALNNVFHGVKGRFETTSRYAILVHHQAICAPHRTHLLLPFPTYKYATQFDLRALSSTKNRRSMSQIW